MSNASLRFALVVSAATIAFLCSTVAPVVAQAHGSGVGHGGAVGADAAGAATRGHGGAGEMRHGRMGAMGKSRHGRGDGEGRHHECAAHGRGHKAMRGGVRRGREHSMRHEARVGPRKRGWPIPALRDLSVDDVRAYVEAQLASIGNARLKVGSIAADEEDSIVAHIVTVEDSLVQRIRVDVRSGRIREID